MRGVKVAQTKVHSTVAVRCVCVGGGYSRKYFRDVRHGSSLGGNVEKDRLDAEQTAGGLVAEELLDESSQLVRTQSAGVLIHSWLKGSSLSEPLNRLSDRSCSSALPEKALFQFCIRHKLHERLVIRPRDL